MQPIFTFPTAAEFEFPKEFKSSSLSEKSCQTFRIQRSVGCGSDPRKSSDIYFDEVERLVEEEYIVVTTPYQE